MAGESDDLKAALLGLRKLKARVGELEAATRAPIAIIGMAGRLPGADDVDAWWQLLRAGRDAVSDVPPDRWDVSAHMGAVGEPGTTRVRRGGFLSDVQRFDADFFGISHREARSMDPQQRLLLETAWQALEDAGRIADVEGSNTGVYLGVALTDWDRRTLNHLDPALQDVYAGTGVFNSVAAGRISYALGMRGPNVSLDTACSSSLVSVHLAVSALRSRECDMALAGGVNLLISPDATLYFDRMGALAQDGRCKAFDASADGYVRAEGVGMVVLKRLDDALRDGDRVLAVVRGSAIGQDGRSNGLTAPSPDAQKSVLRAALAQSGLKAGDVGLIEAHGTGTPLGDPIEFDAIREVYGEGEAPLWIGAAKTNVGHAEAAAGIVGVLKVVQALRHREIPANLHLREVNPRVPIAGTRFDFPRRLTPWVGQRAAGVSGFGMSGTNAHLVLAAAPESGAPVAGRRQGLLVLSAPDQPRLTALAAAASARLRASPADFDDALFTAQVGRVHQPVRQAWVVRSALEAAETLDRWLADPVGVEVPRKRPKLALWCGGLPDAVAVAALAADEPALAAQLAMAEAELPGDDLGPLRAGLALGRLWSALGYRVGAVGGAGDGELVAAVLSGELEPAEAAALWRDRTASIAARRPSLWSASAAVGGLVEDPVARWRAWASGAADAGSARAALRERGFELQLDAADPSDILGQVASLYRSGHAPDWAKLHAAGRRRAPWPLTPFAGPRLWLDDPVEALRAERKRDDRIWEERWVPASLSSSEAPSRWVTAGVADAIVAALGATPLDASLDAVQAGDRLVLGPALDAVALIAGAKAAQEAGAAFVVLVDGDSPARGVARVLSQELDAAWGGLVDSDGATPSQVAELLRAVGGDELQRVNGQVCCPRLVAAKLPSAGWTASSAGAWWITGGLGAMGAQIASWLVDRGARWLVLTSRGAPSDDLLTRIDSWRAGGVVVDVLRGDLGRTGEAQRLRQVIGGPVVGVIHAAGALDDAPATSLTAARFAAVQAPKLDAAEALAEATAADALAAFVLISSATVSLGIPGQAAYAAANAGLRGLSRRLRAAGRPVVLAEFGPWELGMADEVVRQRLEAVGIGALRVDEGLDLLGRALDHAGEDRVLIRLDPARYAAHARGRRVAALLGAVPEIAVSPVSLGEVDVGAAAAEVLATVLGRADASGLDRSRGFFELGLDSMTAIAFARALRDRFGLSVPDTVAFDHGDLDALTAWLSASLAPAPRVALVAASAGRADEPVAIIGMACRFPQADDPEAFWRLLVDGGDVFRKVPADRWDADAIFDAEPGPGRSYVREAAFLDDVAGFDPAFFGISPREARVMDPQQRLLLEVGVEALQDALLPLVGLVRTRVGVFVGVPPSDYARRFDAMIDPVDAYVGTGNEASFAAGRLAYVLGVQGPAIGMNTACSTSLVTLHLAAQALLSGDCEVALAGGVNLLLAPDSTVQLCQLQALSPTARCHTFDASADGYARGEGCGVVVLKRLSAAQRDGDRVLAVVRASAVNHDGPSAGLTVPSGSAQQALLQTVLDRAGLVGADVGFVEVHGTGTKLGDPIEIGAVKAVYGDRPSTRPLVISSVKTHIGHTELAAGVAGLIAAVQSMRHRAFAPHLGFRTPNPALDLDFPVRIPLRPEPWVSEGPRRAAISSFGLSGTNAHVLLEEAPEEIEVETTIRSHHVLLLSGRSEAAVRGLAARLITRLTEAPGDLADLAFSLATGRSRETFRAVVVASDAAEAVTRLEKIRLEQPLTRGAGRPVVWMFTGQGAQSAGMARDLYETWPVFREVIDRSDAVVRKLRRASLVDVLFAQAGDVNDTAWTQPALYAVECGLAELLRSFGLQPAAVIGHSVGELAGAFVAGVLSLEDGCQLVCERGRLMSELPRDGGMAQVALPEAEVRRRLTGTGLDVAAANTPDETVVSGGLFALDALLAGLEADGVRVRRLVVSHAFHSSLMDGMLAPFEDAVRRVSLRLPSVPVLSNLTARPESALLVEPLYWRRHVREAVRFADGLRAAPADAILLELGPHPVLSSFAARVRPDAVVIPTLRRDHADGAVLGEALGALWAAGVDVDWRAWDSPWRRKKVSVPTTPWDHQRLWVDAKPASVGLGGAGLVYARHWTTAPAGPGAHGAWRVAGPGADALAAALASIGESSVCGLASTVLAGERLVLLPATNGPTDRAPLAAAVEAVAFCRSAGARLVLVAREGGEAELATGGLWALARNLAIELPAADGGLVVLGEGADMAGLAGALVRGLPIARVTGEVSVPILERVSGGSPVKARGTWWITGGFGALGLALAERLVQAGAERLLLTGRSAPGESAEERLAALSVPVLIGLGDVSDSADVRRILAGLDDALPLRGVVHAAGALDDVALRDLDPTRLERVLRPKVDGAWNLHEATAGLELDAFVLLSSAAGTLGWRGQANYGAANAWMDGLARFRRARGLVATSVAFGPWAGPGMADERVAAAMYAVGMRPLSPSAGTGGLERALSLGLADALVVDLDWETWAKQDRSGLALALVPPNTAPVVAVARRDRRSVEAAVRAAVANVLGLPDPDAIDATTGLFELGLDSLMAVALARAITDRLGVRLGDTAAFDHGSIDALVGAVLAIQAPEAAQQGGTTRVEHDPICIIGMACRFPGGADDLDAFWQLMVDGRDAVGPVPRERWDNEGFYDSTPGVPGRTYVREGGFLSASGGGVDGFEPALFGISPKEALRMDPQQRLLLELSWSALEHAGIAPDRVRGTKTGVIVGIGGHDYERVIERAGPMDEDDAYTGTGNDLAFAAGRVAWQLGGHGPSLSLDTACSSSLVAIHLAARALADGDADLMLAGGVRLMLSPESTLRLSALHALSPRGRCRTFDAGADGYGRGEGCGVVVLKRLSDARRDGDRVLAVLAAAVVNHDGPSSGLTVPSGTAQTALLKEALCEAGLTADAVDVLEAHGTGTALGDPIEMGAVKTAFGGRSAERPLYVGSVKTNLGHLELAAGVAGVIKTVLAMQHGVIPAQLHFEGWNPAIDHAFPVQVVTQPVPWPADHRRVAGVSAFGLSGTNAHVLLADPPAADEVAAPSPRDQHLLTLSSATAAGLDAAAERLAAWLDQHPAADLADVGWTLAGGRARLRHRRAVVAATPAEASSKLGDASLRFDGEVRRGTARPKVALLFTGQGSQYAGMARGLYDAFPVVRETLDRADRAMRGLRGEGLLPVLFPRAGGSPIDQTAWTQPALFAVELAVARLWASLGVEADVVLGHSIGEIAAAVYAGVMSDEDGLALVEARGRLMQALPQDGAMGAIFASEAAVRAELGAYEGLVDVAAINGPEETVISGDLTAVRAVMAVFEAQETKVRELVVSHAFHSAKMDPMLDAFEGVVRGLTLRAPQIPLISDLTARPETTALTEPGYWRRHVREAVRFAPAVQAAADLGVAWFIEVGPHPVLSGLAARTLGPANARQVPSLRRGQSDAATFGAAVAVVHTAGFDLDLSAWDAGARRRTLELPGTVFQRRRFWVDGGEATPPGPASAPTLSFAWREVAPLAAPRRRWWTIDASADLLEALGGEVTALRSAGDELQATLTGALIRGRAPEGVVIDLSTGDGEPVGRLQHAASVLVAALAALPKVPLWLRTDRAFGADPRPDQAALWGLWRVLALEHPASYGGVIDTEGASPSALADALGDPAEDQTRVVGARRLVARLERSSLASAPDWRGVTVITGGLGALGLALAEHLVEQGARALVLSGRRLADAAVGVRIEALRARGATVVVVAADVADLEDVARLLDAARALGPLGVVFHAAGVLDDALLAGLDPARVPAVLRPKVDGARHLAAQATDARGLVFFSSATAWLGAHAQGAYALANGYLDGLARSLAAQGRRAVSVALGPVAGLGMAAGLEARMAERGIRPLGVAAAMVAVARAASCGLANVAVADADWATYASTFGAGRGLLRELAPPSPEVAPVAVGRRERKALAVVVAETVASVLGLPAADLDPTAGFFELGLDSLMAVTLVDRLSKHVGRELPSSLVFDHPSVMALVAHLAGEEEPAPVAHAPALLSEPIAIVGLAARFPGAPDADAFWELLRDGVCAVGEAPRSRWPEVDALYDPEPGTAGRLYTTKGAFLDDIESFDAGFFGISPREAAALDPQQRLMLEVCFEALEDAAIPSSSVRGSRAGVYVGMGASEYDGRFVEQTPSVADTWSGTGNDTSFAAGRIAYVLGAHGPTMTVNTACSASLVALHLAVSALRLGECDLAFAGGVNLMVSSDSTVRLSALRALSPTGACRAFDADADGYVRGEGAGVVVIERLADALANGHRVLAVVRATGVNHGGPSSALTVPSGTAQTALLRDVWRRAGITGDDLGYLEAHGTGTKLGDPIEARALAAALGPRSAPLPVGSVKTNIGHTELAAGAAGLIKTVLALRHGVIPAHLHLARQNPEIPESLPLVFPTSTAPWRGPKIAGVSSFGLSGTNAHAVIEGWTTEPTEATPAPGLPVLLPLAARSAGALQGLAHGVAGVLGSLVDVATSAAVARSSGHHRLVVVADDAAAAARALRGEVRDGRIAAEAPPAPPRVAWLFSGQGGAYAGMGAALRGLVPGSVFAEVDAAFSAAWGAPMDALRADLVAQSDTAAGQVAHASLAAALVGALRAWGAEPDVVVGHGVGELVAAFAAGLWTLDELARVVVARARALAAQPGGAMASFVASPAVVEAALARQPGALLWIAAVNGPEATVVGGDPAALRALADDLAASGVAVFPLPARHALHTPAVAGAGEAVAAAVAQTASRPLTVAWVSASTGAAVGSADGAFWSAQLSSPVRFVDAVRAAEAESPTVFLEIGPAPQLLGFVRRIVDVRGRALLPSLRRDREAHTLLESVGELWARGGALDLSAVLAPLGGHRVDLPKTPFVRKRHWVDLPSRSVAVAAPPLPATVHAASPGEVVRNHAARLLGLAAADLDPRRPLAWQGFDSLMATELKRVIDQQLAITLPVDAVVSGPSVAELTATVEELVAKSR